MRSLSEEEMVMTRTVMMMTMTTLKSWGPSVSYVSLTLETLCCFLVATSVCALDVVSLPGENGHETEKCWLAKPDNGVCNFP